MRLGLFVNDVKTERPEYTTTRLALTATERGDEVWYISVSDFAYDCNENLLAHARRSTGCDLEAIAFALADDANKPERINVAALDVLFLRGDPGEDPDQRAWTKTVGSVFGEMAAKRGVLVVNDPTGLARALNKMYFHDFPPEVRPRTLVTRDRDEVHGFVSSCGGRAVIKPLQGSGGLNVFMINPDDAPNINQMFEAIARDGYVVVQEYLDAAEYGDVRMFVMNGKPLRVNEHYAAFRRTRQTEDLRTNISTGAEPEPVEVDETMLSIAERCGPKLVQDGMFLAGLDVVGDKLLEVNVFSPGGLGSSAKVTGADFTAPVLESLERKLALREKNGSLTNRVLATM